MPKPKKRRPRQPIQPATSTGNTVTKSLAAVVLAVVTGSAEGISPRMVPGGEPENRPAVVLRREEKGRLYETVIPFPIDPKASSAGSLPPEAWQLRYVRDGREETLEMWAPGPVFHDRLYRHLIGGPALPTDDQEPLPAVELVISPYKAQPTVVVDFSRVDDFTMNNTFELSPGQAELLRKAGRVEITYQGQTTEPTKP